MSTWHASEQPWGARGTEAQRISEGTKNSGWTRPTASQSSWHGLQKPVESSEPVATQATVGKTISRCDSSPAPVKGSPNGPWGPLPSPKLAALPLFPSNHQAPPQQTIDGWDARRNQPRFAPRASTGSDRSCDSNSDYRGRAGRGSGDLYLRHSSMLSSDSARRVASSSYPGSSNRPRAEENDQSRRFSSSSSNDQMVDLFESQLDFERLGKLQSIFDQRQVESAARRKAHLQAKRGAAAAIRRRKDHPVFKVLKDRKLVSRLYAAMCQVEPDETQLLLRLVLISKQFHEAMSPILFSGIQLSSTSACDRLFDSLSNSDAGRGKLLMAQLRCLRLVSIESRDAARLFILVGHQLTDVQMCIIEEEAANESERARQRTRVVDGLSRCRRLERFAIRQSIIKATQMAMLLALWPRLHTFDSEGAIPAISEAGVKQALLPRLKHIILHTTAARSEVAGFLRYFLSPLSSLELHGVSDCIFIDYHFKRLKRIYFDGNIPSRDVLDSLQRGQLPALRLLICAGGDPSLADECRRRGIRLTTLMQ